MHFRFFWLTALSGCRVVRASMAERRPLTFWAMCGATGNERSHVVTPIGAESHAAGAGRMAHDISSPRRCAPAIRLAFISTVATMSPLRFSISVWLMKLSLAFLPRPRVSELYIRASRKSRRHRIIFAIDC
jgi:hypothetical protein